MISDKLYERADIHTACFDHLGKDEALAPGKESREQTAGFQGATERKGGKEGSEGSEG